MRVAIVHYHLRPGGVTRVIETAARALAAAGVAHVVLAGEAPAGGDLPVRVVPGLGYLSDAGSLTAASLVAALRHAAAAALGAPPDVWHFHNHALGKNVLLAEAVALLAAAGERLVLQLHDLVEDGRPANHALVAHCRRLYPVGGGIRYAFINSRDRDRFRQIGLPPETAALLPNAVSVNRAGLPSTAPLVLYPVRGIRRKNLGEVVLLAALAPAGARFAVTGADLGDAWQPLARELRLSVEFAVAGRLAPVPGAATSFEAWRDHATHFLTTSVAEGFGFAFLDAVAFGKPLLGRNLPHLTADHAAWGLRCGCLYDRLLVPTAAVNPVSLETALREALTATYRGYGREISPAELARALAALAGDGWLDFGNLPERLQRDVIVRLRAEPDAFELLVEINGTRVPAAAWLAEQLGSGATVDPAGLAPWSEANYQVRLLAVYQSLPAQPAAGVSFLDSARLLDLCLTPETFHFLCGS